MKPSSGQFDKYGVKPGDSEPHYKDHEFDSCPECGARGKMMKDDFGVDTFFHRVNKKNGSASMWGFEEGHRPSDKDNK